MLHRPIKIKLDTGFQAGSSVLPPFHGLALEKNQLVWTRSSPGTTYIFLNREYLSRLLILCKY